MATRMFPAIPSPFSFLIASNDVSKLHSEVSILVTITFSGKPSATKSMMDWFVNTSDSAGKAHNAAMMINNVFFMG